MAIDEAEQRQAQMPAAASAGETATAPLSIGVEYADRVNFAMQQNGVPLVERVSLTNTGESAAERVVLTVTLETGECEPWIGRIDRIDPGSTFHIEPDGLHLGARQLATRTEA